MEHTQKCDYCHAKIRSFKTSNDWNKRKLHKTCYKKIKEEQNIEDMMKRLKLQTVQFS